MFQSLLYPYGDFHHTAWWNSQYYIAQITKQYGSRQCGNYCHTQHVVYYHTRGKNIDKCGENSQSACRKRNYHTKCGKNCHKILSVYVCICLLKLGWLHSCLEFKWERWFLRASVRELGYNPPLFFSFLSLYSCIFGVAGVYGSRQGEVSTTWYTEIYMQIYGVPGDWKSDIRNGEDAWYERSHDGVCVGWEYYNYREREREREREGRRSVIHTRASTVESGGSRRKSGLSPFSSFVRTHVSTWRHRSDIPL